MRCVERKISAFRKVVRNQNDLVITFEFIIYISSKKKKMSDALLNLLVEIASHIITLIILAYIPLVTVILFRAVRLRGLNEELLIKVVLKVYP